MRWMALEWPLFPAQAGVIPALIRAALRVRTVPRASGGDPSMYRPW